MHLLIDGHNLIAQMPGISLADADDEARLVLLLRGYAARKRGRQVLVVFDRGVYGHPQQLNGYSVTCHFAKSPQDADTQLIRRIKALARPGEWALVSSDRAVARVAEERGVRVIGAREFAARLLEPTAPQADRHEEKPDRRLNEAEIAEWLQIFGQPPEEDATPPDPPGEPDRRDAPVAPRKQKRRRS
ncbi:MAG: NYN domain-containing protein [Roseiflexaceae bacterium]